ncbi:hypothetical protein [Sedimentitalea todarodis]|uniref:DUF1772 domain-containing protein n=1 Tax=Sedimentitalea todarodis TaxID=1631240 RepID=A0ABU3VD13_9RHOB|nr:hypothetical protein [Sedimentitalea todarodis]MDU9004068.1 hypothetical protein [Sedimentitalea todarodis]
MRHLWIGLAGFAGVAVVCLVLMTVWTKPAIIAGAKGAPMFDLRTEGYDHATAKAYLDDLSEPARRLYLGAQRILDTLFPIGLAGALALAIYLGLRRNFGRWALVGALLPSAYFYADMLENAAVAGLLRSPILTPEDVERASTYTILKFQLFQTSLLLLLLCIIGQIVRWSLNRFRGMP